MKPATTAFRVSLLATLFAVLMTTGTDGHEIRGYGQNPDSFYGVFRTDNGNFAMCGKRGERADEVMWLNVVRPDGQVLVNRTIDPFDHPIDGRDIIEVDRGGYLIGSYQGERFSVVRTSDDGRVIWANHYEPENSDLGNGCYEVIQLKGGDFIAAGWGRSTPADQGPFNQHGWLVRINPNGELVWSHAYHGNEDGGDRNGQSAIYGIRDAGDLLVGCGYVVGRGAWIFGVSAANGELQWEKFFNYTPDGYFDSPIGCEFKTLLSNAGAYYAFHSGTYFSGGPRVTILNMLKFSPAGEVLANEELPIDFLQTYGDSRIAAYAHPNGGFSLGLNASNDPRSEYPTGIVRLDEFGNELWQDTLRFAINGSITASNNGKIVGVGRLFGNRQPSNAIMYTLTDHSPPFFRRGGHDADEDYDREHPDDREQQGDGFDITVLQGDVIRFWAEAHDRQNDDITYEWTLNDTVISDSTAAVIAFSNIGRSNVICRISEDDGEATDSLWWRVNVLELYIRSHQPPETLVRLARGEDVDFSLDVRAVEGRQLDYFWLLDSSLVTNDSIFALGPLENFTPLALTVIVSNGNAADSVSWTIQLRSVFRSWQPEGNLISTTVGVTVMFAAVLEEGLPDEAALYWIFEGDTVAADTVDCEINFSTEGQTWVKLAVVAGDLLLEDIVWIVNVNPLEVGGQDITPAQFGLFTVSPNPFNSTLTIRYSVGAQGLAPLQLAIYDLSGRLVVDLLERPDSKLQTPNSKLIWDASSVPAGVYLVRLQSGTEISTKKVVLMR